MSRDPTVLWQPGEEFAGRTHFTVGQDGWEEVADYALDWAVAHASRPAVS